MTAAQDVEKPAHSDVMLAEAEQLLTPPPPPPGAPALRAFHQLDRRSRAQLMKLYARISPGLNALDERVKTGEMDVAPGGQLDTDDAASLVELLADVEDILAIIAVDEVAFRRWAATHDDSDLLALLRSFAGRLGEASGSSA